MKQEVTIFVLRTKTLFEKTSTEELLSLALVSFGSEEVDKLVVSVIFLVLST